MMALSLWQRGGFFPNLHLTDAKMADWRVLSKEDRKVMYEPYVRDFTHWMVNAIQRTRFFVITICFLYTSGSADTRRPLLQWLNLLYEKTQIALRFSTGAILQCLLALPVDLTRPKYPRIVSVWSLVCYSMVTLFAFLKMLESRWQADKLLEFNMKVH